MSLCFGKNFMGHPILIFSETKKKKFRRFFLINFIKNKKITLENKTCEKSMIFSVIKIFAPFFNSEIRKKRFEIYTKYSLLKKSNCRIKDLTQPVVEKFPPPKIIPKGEIVLKIQKNKNFFFQKKLVSSYCFLSQENFLVTSSSPKKIEVIKIGKKNPFFSIKWKKFQLSNISNSAINSNIFESSGKFQTKIWKLCPEIKKFQIFSLKHRSILTSSKFRPEENVVDFCFSKKKWKSFDVESEKWFLNQCFSEEIISIEKKENKPIFAISFPEKIKIFDFRLGKTVLTIEPQEGKIFSIKWNKGISKIFSCGTSNKASLWDLRFYNKETKCLKHQDYLTDIAFHPNSKVIFTNSFDKTTKIWCRKSLNLIKTILCHENKVLNNKLSNNGFFFACLDEKKILKIFLNHI